MPRQQTHQYGCEHLSRYQNDGFLENYSEHFLRIKFKGNNFKKGKNSLEFEFEWVVMLQSQNFHFIIIQPLQIQQPSAHSS